MESGFIKANSSNLPIIDCFTVANFLATNSNFCSVEFRNVKTSMSARQSYRNDAVGYVQLHRNANLCTVKCKISPEHKVRSKPYSATMVVDEKNGVIVSVDCHDCAASQGGCKHAVAFIMWVHRRSKEPSCTSVECYWKKSRLSKVGTTLKFVTSKELSKGVLKSYLPDPSVLSDFLEFLGQITASKAHDVTKCKTPDGSLIAQIMGGKLPDTPAMKCGRKLEDALRKIIEVELWVKIENSGLLISKEYLMIAGSPDEICDEFLIEIKCPTHADTYKNYV
ncbi:hypothetical protein EVAR_42378_1 [Eumeta japonica]|uniref:YqaJ viral recombinase domain-containing protein n=1 Tax=Eumeta variegata TaxID=151549 RepID=A0A4C1YLC6_EUMVA|nr:hypothetical protein EVAR_42378_1 [Eumeta japonica]